MSLTSVLFTEYRRRVLGLLLLRPEHSYHLREIARLTGTVPGTLQREMTKLCEAGIVAQRKQGNQVHYSANRENPIFEELASILRKTSGLADVLAAALLPLAGRIEVAFVFGSIASGRARPGSDIDLMVIGDAGFNELVLCLHGAQEQLGREINPKLYPRNEWQALLRKKGAFARDVMEKPKLFVLGNEEALRGQKKVA